MIWSYRWARIRKILIFKWWANFGTQQKKIWTEIGRKDKVFDIYILYYVSLYLLIRSAYYASSSTVPVHALIETMLEMKETGFDRALYLALSSTAVESSNREKPGRLKEIHASRGVLFCFSKCLRYAPSLLVCSASFISEGCKREFDAIITHTTSHA
jgi:hypothetical protein